MSDEYRVSLTGRMTSDDDFSELLKTNKIISRQPQDTTIGGRIPRRIRQTKITLPLPQKNPRLLRMSDKLPLLPGYIQETGMLQAGSRHNSIHFPNKVRDKKLEAIRVKMVVIQVKANSVIERPL